MTPTSYRRARAVLLVAVVFAAATVATSFPLETLLRQRSELSAAAAELAKVRSHNAALSAQVTSLSQRSTIVSIAREEYGLVHPGQVAVVILPGRGDPAIGSGSLAVRALPASDLVPTSASSLSGTTTHVTPSVGVWSRTLSHLEFWRWAF